MLVLVLTLPMAAPPLWAGVTPCEQRGLSVLVNPPSLDPPLDRLVSLHVSDISLKDALDRLAAAARIRLIYTVETLPLDRSVCVALDSVPVGQILATLLAGIPAEPIATGPEQIVLAPAIPAASSMPPFMLDRIVVTGSSVGAAQKPLSLTLSTLDGRRLAQGSVSTLAEAMNTGVPGLFMWRQSPSSFLAQYGSVRGSSSFGLSYPKVYIDGIEVANPLLITQISPEAIESIEAIRGPQGAALYGADAISGVINIRLRQDGSDGGRRLLLRTGFRLSESRFAVNPALEQTHGLDLRAGPSTRSAGLNVEMGTTGAFVPNASARQVNASGTARVVGARTILTGTARYFSGYAGTAANPLLPTGLQSLSTAVTGNDTSSPEEMEQHTVGMNLKVQQTNWLTYSLVAGVDGYTLNGVHNDGLPLPSAAEAALVAARGGANRATFRLSSVARLITGNALSADLTVLSEHSPLHEWVSSPTTNVKETAVYTANSGRWLSWRSNSGVGGQLNVALVQRLFFTGGLRVERATNVTGVSRLPMLGLAWIPIQGAVTMKLRSAYGKGIRWPQTTARALSDGLRPGTDTISSLAPEEQAGIEGGVDLLFGRAVSLQITRFDQTASGLIQRVLVPFDTVIEGQNRQKYHVVPQNVGEIGNRGWELQGSVHQGPLTLAGTFTLVDSKVTQVPRTYTGDLRPGDRMLGVPKRTASGSVMWSGTRWSGTVTAYRAKNWIYYDRLAIAQLYAATHGTVSGTALRKYWRWYDGVTHLRATLTRDVWRSLSVMLTGDNLLNNQTGEPDNIAVLPGRTITVGLRGAF